MMTEQPTADFWDQTIWRSLDRLAVRDQALNVRETVPTMSPRTQAILTARVIAGQPVGEIDPAAVSSFLAGVEDATATDARTVAERLFVAVEAGRVSQTFGNKISVATVLAAAENMLAVAASKDVANA